jgi:hypothetical protein
MDGNLYTLSRRNLSYPSVSAAPQDVDDVIQTLDPSRVVDLVRAHQQVMGTEPANRRNS